MHYFIMINKKDIKELRIALKMSQKELADKLGVSVRTIANYESGGVIPESKYKILASLSDPIAKKIHTVITGDSSIKGNNNISNTGVIGSVDSESFDENEAFEFLRSQLLQTKEMINELAEQRKDSNAMIKHFLEENKELKEKNKELIAEVARLKKMLNM